MLKPFEYTKIDKIIEVIFTATQNVEAQKEIQPSTEEVVESREVGKQARTDLELLNARRQQAVDTFATIKRVNLVRRSTTLFSDADKKLRVCCAVSKRYEKDYQPYWYAYHPAWDTFLAEGQESFFVLACMDRQEGFAIPYSWLSANKLNLNTTDRGEKSYWHLPITTLDSGDLALNLSKIGTKVSLAQFRFSFDRVGLLETLAR